MRKTSLLVCVLIAIVAPGACERGRGSAAGPGAGASSQSAALPAGLFLSAAPEGARDVKDAKASVKRGEKIVLVGRIGGSKAPFVDGRAVFTLVDQRLKACGEGTPDDDCKTPWDFCCEPRSEITANTATVQVAGADGQPLKAGLDGVGGLKPLARVVVSGTVAGADGSVLLINADGLHVSP